MTYRTESSMSKVHTAISIVVAIVGVGLALLGLTIEPHSNPETGVQIVVWSIVIGGIALVVCGVKLALRWKRP